jgi:hypothetical protein
VPTLTCVSLFLPLPSTTCGERERENRGNNTKVRCEGCINVRVLEHTQKKKCGLLCVMIQCAFYEDADDNSSKHAGMHSVRCFSSIFFFFFLIIKKKKKGQHCTETYYLAAYNLETFLATKFGGSFFFFFFASVKEKKMRLTPCTSDHGNCS